MGRGECECGEEEELVVVREDWGCVREDERTTERARLSRGELFPAGPRREEERGEWSLFTRDERFVDDFSWIFVRVQFSFCLAGELAVLGRGRFVALNAEDFGVEVEETV